MAKTKDKIPLGFCQCGCGARTTIAPCNNKKFGYIKGTPRRFLPGHQFKANPPRTTHGQSKTGAYNSWEMMLDRCRNPNNKRWHRYGGRGIRVCKRWHKFENFLADMGKRNKGQTLDRIDNDGNYEPGNCRWATIKQQATNTSQNRHITALGCTMTLGQWSRRTGLKRETIAMRITRGWTAEQALTTPAKLRATT